MSLLRSARMKPDILGTRQMRDSQTRKKIVKERDPRNDYLRAAPSFPSYNSTASTPVPTPNIRSPKVKPSRRDHKTRAPLSLPPPDAPPPGSLLVVTVGLSSACVERSASVVLEESSAVEVEERLELVLVGPCENLVLPAKLSRVVAAAGVGRSTVSDRSLK